MKYVGTFCCLITKSCPVLCNPIDCSTPGFPVLHYLLEFVKTYVYWVGDSIHPSHPLLPSSPSAINLSQHQDLFHESALHIRWPKYWSFSFSITPSNLGLISFRMDWFYFLAVQGALKSLLQHHNSKASILLHSNLLMIQLSCVYMFTGGNW